MNCFWSLSFTIKEMTSFFTCICILWSLWIKFAKFWSLPFFQRSNSMFTFKLCLVAMSYRPCPFQVVALKDDGCPKVWVVTSDTCQQHAAHGAVCCIFLLFLKTIFLNYPCLKFFNGFLERLAAMKFFAINPLIVWFYISHSVKQACWEV